SATLDPRRRGGTGMDCPRLSRIGLDQIEQIVAPVIERLDPDPLVQTVDAVEIAVDEDSRYAVDRNADALEEDAVSRAGRHQRQQGEPWKIFRRDRLGRAD